MKINPEHEIMWEKLKFPDEKDEDDYGGFEEEEEPKIQFASMMPSMQNPFYQLKTYNFWTGHSNFNITKRLALIMNSIPGVESLEIVSPYRFHISIGSRFVPGEVMSEFANTLTDFLREHEKNTRYE